MFAYKINALEALKTAGYSSYRLRKEKIIGEAMLQKIRDGELPSWETLDKICGILHCQPGDIIQHQPQETQETESEECENA